MTHTVRKPISPKEWEDYYQLRYDVLRAPLNQPIGSERNDGDLTGEHFALYEGTILRAIARLDIVDSETAQTRFVAVDTISQGKGYGRIIMEAVEAKAREKGYQKMILHARDYALDFYLRLGYKNIAPSYKLFDILQHFKMEKQL